MVRRFTFLALSVIACSRPEPDQDAVLPMVFAAAVMPTAVARPSTPAPAPASWGASSSRLVPVPKDLASRVRLEVVVRGADPSGVSSRHDVRAADPGGGV